jgi:protein-tyrosine phosphatase
MIDLHAHILPGLDDGPESWDKALEMCRVALEDGIQAICATSHVMPGTYDNDRSKILESINSLRGRLREEGWDIEIIPGSEVYVSEGLIEAIEKGKLLTINDMGRYLLIEFPLPSVSPLARDLILRLKLKGITPILAHPERNQGVIKDPSLVYDLVIGGALVQANTGSLLGKFGRDVAETARKLLRRNLVHVIASDAHSPHGRPPVLSEGLSVASKWIGNEEAIKLVTENPRRIIAGEALVVREPLKGEAKESFIHKVRKIIG